MHPSGWDNGLQPNRYAFDVSIHHLLTSWGYLAVLALVAAESLGVPLPGETIVIAAGAYAGSTHKLSVWLIFLAAAAAAVAGNAAGFFIGNKGGYRLLIRYGHYLRVTESHIKVGLFLFDHHGGKFVFFGRFVSIFRTYIAILAGTNKMKLHRFLVHSSTSALVWAALYSFGAYAVGTAIGRVSTPAAIAIGATAVLAAVISVVAVRRRAGLLTAKAEAAYPGPLGR